MAAGMIAASNRQSHPRRHKKPSAGCREAGNEPSGAKASSRRGYVEPQARPAPQGGAARPSASMSEIGSARKRRAERATSTAARPSARSVRGGRSPPSPPGRGGSHHRSTKCGARTSEASAEVVGAAPAWAATAAKTKSAQRVQRAEVQREVGQPTGWRGRAASPRHGAPSSAMRLRNRLQRCTFEVGAMAVVAWWPSGPGCDCSGTASVATGSGRRRQEMRQETRKETRKETEPTTSATTCNVQRATFNVQRATFNVVRSPERTFG